MKSKMTPGRGITAVVFIIIFTGCATYQISATNLSGQLNGNVVSKGYLFAHNALKGNDVRTIRCVDKNGHQKEIAVTNRTGIRIIKNDNTKTTYYLNTILIRDSTITGSKTHFFMQRVNQ